MKIRNGFVSNSSSSSFVLFGVNLKHHPSYNAWLESIWEEVGKQRVKSFEDMLKNDPSKFEEWRNQKVETAEEVISSMYVPDIYDLSDSYFGIILEEAREYASEELSGKEYSEEELDEVKRQFKYICRALKLKFKKDEIQLHTFTKDFD